MNRSGVLIASLIFLCCIFFSIKTAAGQVAIDSDHYNKDSLLTETRMTRFSLEKLLAETRNQLAQFESKKAAFETDFTNFINQVHIFRFNLRQKLAYLQRVQEQLTGFNPTDTLTYSRSYWQEFTENLRREFDSAKWNLGEETGDSFKKISSGLDKLIDLLNVKALRHPMVKDAITNLLQFVLKNPLEPSMMADASNGVTQLREALSGTTWEPRILTAAKGSILGVKSILTKINEPLEVIETDMLEVNEKMAKLSQLLDHRLAKLDTLIGSAQVIERNLHSIEAFDPTEVRQQLIFLRNQNQFIDYEHRVLKSFNGTIESAIKTGDWKAILRAIARQDPNFGELNLEKNAYILFVGASEVNRHFLIHERNHRPSDYLYAIKNMTAIWLEDNKYETYEIDMSIELLQSEFELTFGQFKSIFEARKRGEALVTEPTLFFYGMKKISDISSPAKINLSMRRELIDETGEAPILAEVVETNDVFSTSYKIHERSLAHISVGLAAGFVKKSNFVISGNQLKVSQSGDKELDQQLYALFNFHLGARDVDRFERYPFLSPGKLMLQAGIGVSKNPLDRLYLGFGYRFARDVQLDVLYYWRRKPDPSQSVSLDDAASLVDAKHKFDRVYQSGNFAIGLSFYPRRLFGFLGI